MNFMTLKLTLHVHEAATRWNALCAVLETTALLQGLQSKFPRSAAWLYVHIWF
jgi:hypothetical protein